MALFKYLLGQSTGESNTMYWIANIIYWEAIIHWTGLLRVSFNACSWIGTLINANILFLRLKRKKHNKKNLISNHTVNQRSINWTAVSSRDTAAGAYWAERSFQVWSMTSPVNKVLAWMVSWKARTWTWEWPLPIWRWDSPGFDGPGIRRGLPPFQGQAHCLLPRKMILDLQGFHILLAKLQNAK